jgi:uncharacterized membrane protein
MTTLTPAASPRTDRRRSRLAGVDAARGLAVLGMVAVHVLPPFDDDGGVSLPEQIAGGRSSAAFAVLAGVGVALATRRGTDRWRSRLRLLLRALLIGALGLHLGGLDIEVAVILAYYAVFFVLLLPFLGWPPRWLLAAAAVVALLAPVLSYRVRPSLPSEGFANPTWSSLQDPAVLLSDLLLTGVYPAVPWAAYLLTGLAVGQLALDRTSTAVRLAVAGAALWAAASAASALLLGPLGGYTAIGALIDETDPEVVAEAIGPSFFGNVPTESWWFLAVDARHSSTTPDLVGTTGTALLALGVCLLLTRRTGPLLAPLAAVGSMPLTVYSAHLYVLHWTDSTDPTRYYLLQVGTALVVAPLWRRYVGRGPLEAALALVGRTVRAPT